MPTFGTLLLSYSPVPCSAFESNTTTPKFLTLALQQLLQSTSSLLVRHKKAGAGTGEAAHRKKKKNWGAVFHLPSRVPMRTTHPRAESHYFFLASRILAHLLSPRARQPTPLVTWIETQEHRRLGEGEMWSNPG